MRVHSKVTAEAAFGQLQHLLSSKPVDISGSFSVPETQQWLGRVLAIIEEVLGAGVYVRFSSIRDKMRSDIYGRQAEVDIVGLIYEALAKIELELPVQAQGAFIPAGNALDAFAAVSKILGSAQKHILIVDPYLDEKFLLEFAQLADAKVQIDLLADRQGVRATLAPAAAKWKQQFVDSRPLKVRLAPARSLHDRLILVDNGGVWTVGQSFNALAARAPTSFSRVDRETAGLKIEAYQIIWEAAVPLE